MNKYKHKIPKEDLKRFAKEIAKKLVNSDFKAGRVKDPTKIDERQQKKVKDFCRQFFDKAYQKHKKHEQEKAARKARKESRGKVEVTTQSSTVISPEGSPGHANLSPRPDDGAEDIEMSDGEDMDASAVRVSASPSSAQTPSERNGTLKRKRVDPDDAPAPIEDEEDQEPAASPAKRINTSMDFDTPPPPPPPPPPAPPVETPPASTPREGEGETDFDLHLEDRMDIHADTNFRGRSMADVLAQAQQEDSDGDMDDKGIGMELDNPMLDAQQISSR